MIDNISSLIKLPVHIIFILFIILGTLLFSPDCFLEILKLYEFIEKYKIFFGVAFLFLGGFLIANIIINIYKCLLPTKYDNNKYIEILRSISNILLLSEWDVFIDNAIRGIVIDNFIENQELFNKLILTTVWPKKYSKRNL